MMYVYVCVCVYILRGKNFNIRILCEPVYSHSVCIYVGMIGVPGIAHRLFGALKAAHISVMFIAQASSEHSKCIAYILYMCTFIVFVCIYVCMCVCMW